MSKSPSISKFRSATSQFCAAFPYFCLTMTFGSSLGFETILISELYKDNSEIATTVDQLSWFAALDILNVLGIMAGGALTQRFGTRSTALLSSLIFSSSWLLYHLSTSISTLMLARVLSTLTATYSLTNPFISEISEPNLRGTFLVIAQMCLVSGTFISLLLGTFMNWRTIALVNLCMPIFTAFTVLGTPSSPIWLANRGRLDEAEKALCRLRGWVKPEQVQSELQTLMESAQKSNADEKAIGWQGSFSSFYKIFLQRSFYLPLITTCLMILVFVLGGGPMVRTYSTIIFRVINSPIEESVASAIMGATSIIGKVIVISLIRHTGKRILILSMTFISCSCEILIATVGILKLTNSYFAWIPSIAVLVSNLARRSGASTIVFMLINEIFPAPVRYLGVAISYSFNSMAESIGKKMFLYVVDAVTLPVVFGMFAVGNAIAFVTYYFVMPETEGKTLQEIEDHFKRVEIDERSNKSSV